MNNLSASCLNTKENYSPKNVRSSSYVKVPVVKNGHDKIINLQI